jgi:Rieske Fe-S protein
MFVLKTEEFPIAAAAERVLDRRRFLCTAGAAAVAVATGEWLAASNPPPTAAEPVVLADAASLAVGTARALDGSGGAQVIAVRIDAATVVAFDRRCPHLGCPVVWSAERERFECPCHRAVFEARSGLPITGPARRGLTPIPVELA